jgi:hypothetical protein
MSNYGLSCVPPRFPILKSKPTKWLYSELRLLRNNKVKWGCNGEVLIHIGLWPFKRGARRELSLFLSLPCEDTARRGPTLSQEESPHQNHAAPWPQASFLHNYEEINFYLLAALPMGFWLAGENINIGSFQVMMTFFGNCCGKIERSP